MKTLIRLLDTVEPLLLKNMWWLFLLAIWLLLAPEMSAQTEPPPDPVESSGSPDWFNWNHFLIGWACAWTTVGPMFVYRLAKKSADDALD
jgi:hypothetical protein